MEQVLLFLEDYGILTAIIAGIGALLIAGLKLLRKKVAESETKLDDEALEAFEDALKKSKEDK